MTTAGPGRDRQGEARCEVVRGHGGHAHVAGLVGQYGFEREASGVVRALGGDVEAAGGAKSFAKARRSGVDHSGAPDLHASLSGTTWSMSIPEAEVTVFPSHSEYHIPDTARHWSPCTASRPSRRSTTSRVSQVPYRVIQCGNCARE
ncbi:hypothetical protein ACFU8Q_28510 [Streptomyces sp. NPDC057543]|uniref:hypothetical protein n=1 Tax=Streptomyces sp. NPDC057543 TaxID=3346163 RepID=UPI00369EE4B4